jgi:16S rRNA processing protein RimM
MYIEESAPAASFVLIKFRGIGTPEEARRLRGAEAVVSRDQAAPLREGEFYVEDLRGLPVVHGEEVIGEVQDILEGGGGSLVEIKLSSGELKVVPFRKEFFAPIDPGQGRLSLLETWILE